MWKFLFGLFLFNCTLWCVKNELRGSRLVKVSFHLTFNMNLQLTRTMLSWILWECSTLLYESGISHPFDRQSWPRFRRTTPGRRHLDHSRWSWTTQSGSSSCGPRRRHPPSPPSCVAGCRSDSGSVNCSCIWMEAMYRRHCWRSLPWRERCPVSGARSCEVTCQSLIGWWAFVRDTLHLQQRKPNSDLFHFVLIQMIYIKI